jgi:DNA-directed RNA polymerase
MGRMRDITEAMRDDRMRAHVNGVNALQAVPWRINERVLELVKWRQEARRDVVEGGVASARVRFAEDMTTATRLVGTDFYTPMNCDFRGRKRGISFTSPRQAPACCRAADPKARSVAPASAGRSLSRTARQTRE